MATTQAPYRTAGQAEAYIWQAADPDYRIALRRALDELHGKGNWGSVEVYNHELPLLKSLHGESAVFPVEYGDIDWSQSENPISLSGFGEIMRSGWEGAVDFVSSPIETSKQALTAGYDIARGMTRQGPGFTQLEELSGGDLPKQQHMAGEVQSELEYQFSPHGIQDDPLRALSTAASLTPTGPLLTAVKAARVPRALEKLTKAADMATGLATGDPLDMGIQALRGGRSIYTRIRDATGRQDPGLMHKVLSRALPAKTKGQGRESPSLTQEGFGQTLSFGTGMPLRTYAEQLRLRHEPYMRGGKPVKRAMGDKGPQLMLYDVMRHHAQLKSPERIDRLTIRAHEAADDLYRSAQQDYNAGMARLQGRMGGDIGESKWNDLLDRMSDHFDQSELGLRIEMDTSPIPDPPKGVPKPDPPIPKTIAVWEKTTLSPFLKDKTAQVEQVLSAILNAHRTEWGGHKVVTLQDVYQMRRDIDQLYRSMPSDMEVAPKARAAYKNIRTFLQDELGELLGPDYEKVMAPYADKIDLLENIEETLGVSHGNLKKTRGKTRKLEPGARSGSYEKMRQALGEKDKAEDTLNQMYLLEEFTGDNDLVPLLIASVTSPIMANTLVSRAALLGTVGAGAYTAAPIEGLEMGAEILVGGIASLAAMSPRFMHYAVASTPAFRSWIRDSRISKKMKELSQRNPSLLYQITEDAVKYGWNVGTVTSRLERAFEESGTPSPQAEE